MNLYILRCFQIGVKKEFLGFRGGAFEVSVLLGCDVAPLGDWYLKFCHVVVLSSGVQNSHEERLEAAGNNHPRTLRHVPN